MAKIRDSGTFPKVNSSTGELLWVDERTEAILTYALCGFANFGALGNMVAGFSQYSYIETYTFYFSCFSFNILFEQWLKLMF